MERGKVMRVDLEGLGEGMEGSGVRVWKGVVGGYGRWMGEGMEGGW